MPNDGTHRKVDFVCCVLRVCLFISLSCDVHMRDGIFRIPKLIVAWRIKYISYYIQLNWSSILRHATTPPRMSHACASVVYIMGLECAIIIHACRVCRVCAGMFEVCCVVLLLLWSVAFVVYAQPGNFECCPSRGFGVSDVCDTIEQIFT